MKITFNKSLSIAVIVFSFLFSSSSVANHAFAVAPGHIYINLNQPDTKTFLIRNTGTQLIHLRVRPVFYPIESRALHAGIPLNAVNEKATSLAPYMLISPQALSLQPGQQREVRVSAHVPSTLAQGTYRGHVLVHMMEIAKTTNSHARDSNANIGTTLNLLMEMAVAVYGEKGNGTPTLAFHCSMNKKQNVIIQATNKTPWHFAGKIRILSANKTLLSQNETIFRDSHKDITLAYKPKHNTTLQIQWTGENTNKKHVAHCTI